MGPRCSPHGNTEEFNEMRRTGGWAGPLGHSEPLGSGCRSPRSCLSSSPVPPAPRSCINDLLICFVWNAQFLWLFWRHFLGWGTGRLSSVSFSNVSGPFPRLVWKDDCARRARGARRPRSPRHHPGGPTAATRGLVDSTAPGNARKQKDSEHRLTGTFSD